MVRTVQRPLQHSDKYFPRLNFLSLPETERNFDVQSDNFVTKIQLNKAQG